MYQSGIAVQSFGQESDVIGSLLSFCEKYNTFPLNTVIDGVLQPYVK